MSEAVETAQAAVVEAEAEVEATVAAEAAEIAVEAAHEAVATAGDVAALAEAAAAEAIVEAQVEAAEVIAETEGDLAWLKGEVGSLRVQAQETRALVEGVGMQVSLILTNLTSLAPAPSTPVNSEESPKEEPASEVQEGPETTENLPEASPEPKKRHRPRL